MIEKIFNELKKGYLKNNQLTSFNLFSKNGIINYRVKSNLKKLKKITGKNILLIKHSDSGFFQSACIDRTTLHLVSKSIQYFKGKPFDLILHTPGGDPFSSIFISRILNQYPSKIRTIIPLYAMSGGTILAMSNSDLYMSNTSCIGPVDPQVGNYLGSGSSRIWERILKYKKQKTKDEVINFAYTGKQYTNSIKKHMEKIIDHKLDKKNKKRFIDLITSGKVEHPFQLTSGELKKFGFKIKSIPDKWMDLLIKIVTSSKANGVGWI